VLKLVVRANARRDKAPALLEVREGVLLKRSAERRIILTFDLDFGEIAALAGGRVTSVILVRLLDAPFRRVIERLTVLSRVIPASPHR
jgi:hypothetical protein